MKKIIYPTIYLLIGFILGVSISQFKTKNQTNLTNEPTAYETEEDLQQKYVINIPAKYFDTATTLFNGTISLKDIYASEPPKEIVLDNTVKSINEDVPVNTCNKSESNFGYCEPQRYESSIDVDSDGVNEKILRIYRGVNHGVEDLYIVKNGRVVFKREGEPISIEPSKSNNGFYLLITHNVNGTLFSVDKIRYVHEDGKFIPVWYQTTYEIQTTQS